MSEDLSQKWHHFKSTGDQQTRNELITHYQPLVAYVARRAVPNAPAHQDREEFESWGNFGLIDAVEKFDPGTNANAGSVDYSVGRAFESYAMRRIHGAILDGLRRADPLTRSARKRVKEIEAATERLESTLGRSVTLDEVAAELKADPEEIRTVYQSMKSLTTSLDETSSQRQSADLDAGHGIVDSLVDVRHDQPELHMEVQELQEILAKRLAGLSEKDRAFAALYYCQQMSLTEIGSELGISESRVGQIRLRVMRQLRGMTAANARYEM